MSRAAILALENGGTKLVASGADRPGEIIDTLREPRRVSNRAGDTLQRLMTMGLMLRNRQQVEDYVCGEVCSGFGGPVFRATNHPYLCLPQEPLAQAAADAVRYCRKKVDSNAD